jgi:hypothetical protein
MKQLLSLSVALFLAMMVIAQSPQKLSYQAVVRNAQGKLVANATVGIRFSILKGSPTGTAVYSETMTKATNVNGLVSVEIGTDTASGYFNAIDWSQGPYYLKNETDPAGGTNFTISGVSQLLSVPYALYAEKANVGPETKIAGGTNITVKGTGTNTDPFIISNGGYPFNNKLVFTSSQFWTVPTNVSKIKVELWGASGGGGGSGAYTYSYSYYLNHGGDGGSGGYAVQVMDVTQNQQYLITIGTGGSPGFNAYYSGYGWYGDSDGQGGGDSWFGTMKAAGGSGGKKGSYAPQTVNGNAGTSNVGPVTGYAGVSNSNILDVWQGIDRSYIGDRVLTSKPGKGGTIQGYSTSIPPLSGENGCAIISFFE